MKALSLWPPYPELVLLSTLHCGENYQRVVCFHPPASPMPAWTFVIAWFSIITPVLAFGTFLFMVLRADLKAIREDMRASETRQREDLKELREKVDSLPLKIMGMLNKAPR